MNPKISTEMIVSMLTKISKLRQQHHLTQSEAKSMSNLLFEVLKQDLVEVELSKSKDRRPKGRALVSDIVSSLTSLGSSRLTTEAIRKISK